MAQHFPRATKKNCQPVKLSFKNEVEIKTFLGKREKNNTRLAEQFLK